jgi:hypothetical protein
MPTYILVQWHPKGTTKASETRLLLYHGTQAQELHERGVDTLPVAQWPMNAVDWTELRKGPSAAPARGASGAVLALGAQMRGPWPEVPESGQPQDVVIGMDRGAWK